MNAYFTPLLFLFLRSHPADRPLCFLVVDTCQVSSPFREDGCYPKLPCICACAADSDTTSTINIIAHVVFPGSPCSPWQALSLQTAPLVTLGFLFSTFAALAGLFSPASVSLPASRAVSHVASYHIVSIVSYILCDCRPADSECWHLTDVAVFRAFRCIASISFLPGHNHHALLLRLSEKLKKKRHMLTPLPLRLSAERADQLNALWTYIRKPANYFFGLVQVKKSKSRRGT